MTAAIKEAARRQLAEEGPGALSLRAVARDLGVVSSALYRYFRNRDELLTALIVDAYTSLGDVAEEAESAASVAGADAGARWLASCRAVRAWSRQHPHEFALVYGSPVPGYRAPVDTIEPAIRVPRLLTRILTEAARAGSLHPPARPLPAPRLVTDAAREIAGGTPAPPYEDLLERAITVWIALVGAISFELYGHLNNAITDHDAYFDAVMRVSAESVGLELST